MPQNQIPVRRWKQWLALPMLGGLFLGASQVVAAQTTPTGDEATRAARQVIINRKLREATHQDSLKGKFEPGTVQQFDISNMQGKPEDVTVTITRVKAPMPQINITRGPAPATPSPPIPYPKGKEPAPKISSGEAVYTYVEQMPALPTGGGIGAIIKLIQDNIVYPAGARQEGKVFVSFIVRADGSMGETKVVKGLDSAYDKAVVAAIQKLPHFVPGMQNGQAVAVSFTVPVTFKN